ncbi:MAG: hypothetical protein EXX96DRAFT_462429, partial [Benjaminiella poitrasii]
LAFIRGALNESIENALFWICNNVFNIDYTDEEKKIILFTRLILNDFYANCLKPTPKVTLNEKT